MEQKGHTRGPVQNVLIRRESECVQMLMTERLGHMGTNNLPFACFRCCYELKMKDREFLKIMRWR